MNWKIALVAEARQIFGRQAAKRLWVSLGLPSTAGLARAARVSKSLADSDVDRFLRDCCVRDRHAKVASHQLYEAYIQWSLAADAETLTLNTFGKRMAQSDVVRRKIGTTYFVGIRLKGVGIAAPPLRPMTSVVPRSSRRLPNGVGSAEPVRKGVGALYPPLAENSVFGSQIAPSRFSVPSADVAFPTCLAGREDREDSCGVTHARVLRRG
ncbi:primase-like DNA-binding domain-containing protein [Mesorhizobium sp. J428]|uniref:primase-like DNA-binding domain-containing protein n=1 Tax=Mesorhizobium sp. J428 TaxID=2898440 RepID=UPI0035AE4048